MTIFELALGGAVAYGFIVAACEAPDYMMKRRLPEPKPDPSDPDAGRDRLVAWTGSVANWMFAATGIVLALGWLLHNCSDFTPVSFWE